MNRHIGKCFAFHDGTSGIPKVGFVFTVDVGRLNLHHVFEVNDVFVCKNFIKKSTAII